MTRFSVRPTLDSAKSDLVSAGDCLAITAAFEGRDNSRAIRALDDAEALAARFQEHLNTARAALGAGPRTAVQ